MKTIGELLYNTAIAVKMSLIARRFLSTSTAKLGRQFKPSFLAAVDEAARKCFGNLPMEDYRTGFKYLKRKPIGPMAIAHYLDEQKIIQPFRDAHEEKFDTALEERQFERLDRLRRNGKGPPKKGHGKRAAKNKKKEAAAAKGAAKPAK